MTDLLSPITIVLQRELLDQVVEDAESAAAAAQEAAEKAQRLAEEADRSAKALSVAREKQVILVDILQAAHVAIRRKSEAMYAAAQRAKLVPYSQEGDQPPAVLAVIYWPLTEDGRYIFAYTPTHEASIGEVLQENKFAEISLDMLIALDLAVLHEMLDHLQHLGVRADAPSAADSLLSPNQVGSQDEVKESVGDTTPEEQHGPNPDIYTADDPSAHVGVPEASWHHGSKIP